MYQLRMWTKINIKNKHHTIRSLQNLSKQQFISYYIIYYLDKLLVTFTDRDHSDSLRTITARK